MTDTQPQSGRLDRHLPILCILLRVWGWLALLVGVSLLLLAAGALAILFDPLGTPVVPGAGFTAGALALLFAILGLFAMAWGGGHVWVDALLVRHHHYGRVCALALAVINLLMLPFGTALGAYALWVLLPHDARHRFEPSSAR